MIVIRHNKPIKQGQNLSFSLDEIAKLLSLESGRNCHEAKEIALKKHLRICKRIKSLQTMETALTGLIKGCSKMPGRYHDRLSLQFRGDINFASLQTSKNRLVYDCRKINNFENLTQKCVKMV